MRQWFSVTAKPKAPDYNSIGFLGNERQENTMIEITLDIHLQLCRVHLSNVPCLSP